ncbi:MAG: hypothetical protein OXC67_06920 [Flavobacteriaceae bacterium]|nr:hypothetical protein [Flavobacteriaceae bacterium]MCY4298249.1 hypothetical protein [Flavobacteriaceae bacterium]
MRKTNFIINRKSLKFKEGVDERIIIYKGNEALLNSKTTHFHVLNFEIYMNWNPTPYFELSGTCSNQIPIEHMSTEFYVTIDNLYFSNGRIIEVSDSIKVMLDFPMQNIESIQNEYVKEVKFSIVNFSVCNSSKNSDFKFKFLLEKSEENEYIEGSLIDRECLHSVIKTLRRKGGFCITHHAHIKFAKAKSIKEVEIILERLILSLRFLNGQDLGFALLNFFNKENEIISWFPKYGNIKSYKSCHRVLLSSEIYNHPKESSILEKMLNFFAKTNDFQTYIDLIHWYCMANINSGYTSGSLILAQAGVELIWNFCKKTKLYGIECEMMKENNKKRKKYAGEKIGELMKALSIPNDIRKTTPHLKAYSRNYNTIHRKSKIETLSHAIVSLRNNLVHSDGKKKEDEKKKEVNIPRYAYFEARESLLLIIEKFIFNRVKFEGLYNKRHTTVEPISWRRIEKFSN